MTYYPFETTNYYLTLLFYLENNGRARLRLEEYAKIKKKLFEFDKFVN